jgi:hypothetical protein
MMPTASVAKVTAGLAQASETTKGLGIAARAGSTRTTDTLLAALGSSDPFVVLDAADGLAARKATAAIPVLAALDIARSPESAPSVIAALGHLASVAEPVGRRAATDRLLQLLAEEKLRSAPESAGNVLALYEAIGRSRDPRGATAIEAELLDPQVSLAAKTVVVEALARLDQPSSPPMLRRVQRELPMIVTADDFEEEVRRELALIVDRALETR